MKRLFLMAVAAVAVMVSGLNANAQIRFGVLGGFTSSSTKAEKITTESVSLYHAGVAAKVSLPYNLAIQPQLIYQVKGTAVSKSAAGTTASADTKVGYVEVPVQIQWGPDLIVCRPYVLAEPFVGYALNVKSVASVAGVEKIVKDFKDLNLNRFEYGLGVGAGVEFWRLQLAFKYFWNFGELAGEAKDLAGALSGAAYDAISSGKSFSGINVSLALFF